MNNLFTIQVDNGTKFIIMIATIILCTLILIIGIAKDLVNSKFKTKVKTRVFTIMLAIITLISISLFIVSYFFIFNNN